MYELNTVGINCDKNRGRGKSINDKPKNIQRAYLFVSMQVGAIKRRVQIGGINASRDDGLAEYLHCCICCIKKLRYTNTYEKVKPSLAFGKYKSSP